jgi:hypothetical protein
MIWEDEKEADRLIGNATNRLGELIRTRADLSRRLENTKLTAKQRSDIQGRINEVDAMSERVQGSIRDIITLGADTEHTYSLAAGSGSSHNVVKDQQTGIIRIEGSTDALHIHEIKHVAMALATPDGLRFNNDGKLRATTPSGERDEIEAYRTQFAFAPNSLPGTRRPTQMGEVNRNYIGGLKNENGQFVYPAIQQLIQNQKAQDLINQRMFQQQDTIHQKDTVRRRRR